MCEFLRSHCLYVDFCIGSNYFLGVGVDRKIVALVICFFILSGCSTRQQGVGLTPAIASSVTFDHTVWLQQAKIRAPVPQDFKNTSETAMTLSLRNYLEETHMLSRVNILPGEIGSNDHQLVFEFDNYTFSRDAHPAYFPAAFFTMTIYIWVNGPIFVDTFNVDGKLRVLDRSGVEIISFSDKANIQKNIGLFDPEYVMSSGIEQRTKVVKGLVDRYAEFLKTSNLGIKS